MTLRNICRNGSQRLTPIPHAAEIDSRQTYKQPGPTFGFNGALRLELRDPPAHFVTLVAPLERTTIAGARVGTSSMVRKLRIVHRSKQK